MTVETEKKLAETAERLGLSTEDMPRNVAIIMDGNGRWAKRQGLPRTAGHQQGGRTVEHVALGCVDLGLETLSLYSFSIENWKRPETEVNALMHLYTDYLIKIRPTLMDNNVKLVHLGRVAQLPGSVLDALGDTMEATANNTGMVLALALNYGSRTEIVDATRQIAEEYKNGKIAIEDINEDCIADHLYTAGLADPDLLIRTANELRVSNFLLWQISYSEFYVTDTLWPDFAIPDMDKAILAYAKRVRRFGEVKDEVK